MKNIEKKEIKNFLVEFCSLEDIERILEGIKNPLKNKWIIKELESLYNKLEKEQKENEYEHILEIIGDQLAFCKYSIQDSKCDPTKYIEFTG